MTTELRSTTRVAHRGRETGRLRVVIAGGGVGAVEALLALRELAGDRVEPVLLAPGPDFVHQPLAVAQPFGAAEPLRIPLAEVAADTGATLWRDSLAGIDREGRVHTIGGDSLSFDALLIAVGARRLRDVPGSITYRGGMDNATVATVLRKAQRGRVRRLVFAVPASVRWPLAIYDLALLSAAHLRERGSEARISLITHEPLPLGLFGRTASGAVEARLAEAGIDLRTSMTPVRFDRRSLELASGTRIPADCVIALPRLEVPGVTGVPQGPRGFIGTDVQMRVERLRRVYAAGDATWFPIKQGGIAAQQADAAASAIAALAGADVEPEPFRPVLRAAILAGAHPLFLRSAVGARDSQSVASDEPLWWPPSKVAGKHLSRYLRDRWSGTEVAGALEDLDPPVAPMRTHTREHRDVVESALRAADIAAARRDFRGALRWLQVVEDLEIALPAPYGDRRTRWHRALGNEPLGSMP